MRHYIVISFLTLLLSACSTEGGDWGNSQTIPETGWAYQDTLFFQTDTLGKANSGPLSLAIAHTDSYPYSNLWLEVSGSDKSGLHYRDTLEIELCDVYGNWHGKKLGTYYQLSTPLPHHDLSLGQKIAIRHMMRVDTLKEINKIAIAN